jgi:hypothetical protein
MCDRAIGHEVWLSALKNLVPTITYYYVTLFKQRHRRDSMLRPAHCAEVMHFKMFGCYEFSGQVKSSHISDLSHSHSIEGTFNA